jgi:hypothetical protein
MSGLLNGTVGVSKTYVGEICDSSNVARAFSWIGLMWGFGSIAGSAFGGLLARPATKYPNVFDPNGFFGTHPYVLPNMIAACVTLTGFILCFLFLTENERKSHSPPAKEIAIQQELGLEEEATTSTQTSSSLGSSASSSSSSNSNPNSSSIYTPNATYPSDPTSKDDYVVSLELETFSDRSDIESPPISGSPSDTDRTSSFPSSMQDFADETDSSRPISAIPSMTNLNNEEGPAYIGGYGNLSSGDDQRLPWYRRGFMAKITQFPAYIKSIPIFQEYAAVWACTLYALLGLMNTMADEVWPLWALTPVSEGGLAFSTDQIGAINAWSGVIQLLFNLAVYPILAKHLGLVKTFLVGLVASILVFPSYPFIRYVPLPVKGDIGSSVLFWTVLGFLAMWRCTATQSCFSSIMTIISNSIYPEHMGAANGMGQSMVAFTRMLAPFSSAAVLALSLSPQTVWPFNYGRLAWYLMSIIGIITIGLGWSHLPTSLNKPRLESEADKNAALARLSISVSDSDLENTAATMSSSLSADLTTIGESESTDNLRETFSNDSSDEESKP